MGGRWGEGGNCSPDFSGSTACGSGRNATPQMQPPHSSVSGMGTYGAVRAPNLQGGGQGKEQRGGKGEEKGKRSSRQQEGLGATEGAEPLTTPCGRCGGRGCGGRPCGSRG